MSNGFRDLVRHHIWATTQLIGFCKTLPASALDATVAGTYGTVIKTLRHLVSSEAGYLYRLTGAWDELPWQGDQDVGLDELERRAAELGQTLKQFLEGEWDSERVGPARGDGKEFDVRASVYLAQIIHHASEHRTQVCTILGATGHEPPSFSAWEYALATGRMMHKGELTSG